MASAWFLRRRAVRIASTHRKALIVILCAFLLLQQVVHLKRHHLNRPPEINSADLLQRRNSFTNPVYDFWQGRGYSATSGADYARSTLHQNKCNEYFNKLDDITDNDDIFFDVESVCKFDLDKQAYKKNRWLRETRVDVMSKLQKKKIKFTDDHMNELEHIYAEKATEISTHERSIYEFVSHSRVFGQCFVEKSAELSKTSATHCQNYYKKLYPWLRMEHPSFEDWTGDAKSSRAFPEYNKTSLDRILETTAKSARQKFESAGCFIHDYIGQSVGAGIVIPILPSNDRKGQITRIRGLIKVLRALRNDLPIQVVYLEKELSPPEKEQLRYTARKTITDWPKSMSRNEKRPEANDTLNPGVAFPKQDIRFVNLEALLDIETYPMLIRSRAVHNPTVMLALASVFNSFQHAIVITSSAIPLDEKFASRLLQRADFEKHGHIFFKMPARFKDKKKRILPGYDEVNNFIRDYLSPSAKDDMYFDIRKRDTSGIISRALNGRVQGILDSSMFAIDKARTANAFLMAANLQFHKLLNHRFEVNSNEASSDYLWLGMELAGIGAKSNFNSLLGAAVGVLTPFENEPHDIVNQAHELCSSSWGQIDSEDNYTILYVTSHQLENWMEEPLFRVSLRQKYVIKNNDPAKPAEDSTLYDSTIKKNPLYIGSSLVPPDHRGPGYAFSKAGEREPNAGWVRADEIAPRVKYPIWCGYDVVAGVEMGNRGVIVDYGETYQTKANFLLDMWLSNK